MTPPKAQQVTQNAEADIAPPPGFRALFEIFGRIGLLSFGGPAAQIALMHRELVEERPWLGERQFLNALSFSCCCRAPRRCNWPPMPGGVCAACPAR